MYGHFIHSSHQNIFIKQIHSSKRAPNERPYDLQRKSKSQETMFPDSNCCISYFQLNNFAVALLLNCKPFGLQLN